jgi:hypothetical protein
MDIEKRITALEADAQRAKLGPFLESLAARAGLDPDEIMAETQRILAATEGQTPVAVMQWIADDVGATLAELEAEAARLMGE